MYLLPSLFTLGNIFLGFLAVVEGLDGHFVRAAILLFSAGVLDALDGRIARLTGTESEFGKAFDSLADVLTFGSTPALLAYIWGLAELGRIGWLAPIFFLICTATRLARFNVQTKSVDSRFFVGLPSPAAAGAIGSFLLIAPQSGTWVAITASAPASTLDRGGPAWLPVLMVVTLFVIGLLMVSTFRYPSFKRIDFGQRRSYRLLIPVTAVLILAAIHPPAFFVSLAVLYTCYGPLAWLAGRRAWRTAERNETDHQSDPQ
jgi:CDP-diacylglycerol--serine O-phosphatidyltransferase